MEIEELQTCATTEPTSDWGSASKMNNETTEVSAAARPSVAKVSKVLKLMLQDV